MTAATTPAEPLPRWDLTTLFPSVSGPEIHEAEQQFAAGLADLQALYDRHDVRSGDSANGAVAAFEEVLAATNAVLDTFDRLEGFAYTHVSGDSTNEAAQQLLSRLQTVEADLKVLRTRFDAWVGRLDPEQLVESSAAANDHAWPLRKAGRRATHQMSEPEEVLAAELGLTGSTAWSRLYEDVSAGITAPVQFPDGTEKALPIFAVRGLATNPDPVLREAAFRAELGAWEAHAAPIAAALNALKGESLALGRRRGWDDPLDAVLEANAVDRPTLTAMGAAVDDALGDFRRYLAAKAQLLGKKQCAFWDLFAPVGAIRAREWDDAVAAVTEAFASYSPELVGLARRALAESWVDAGPRAGKVGGGFCAEVGDGASRILMNFDGSFDSVHTLAHELGHAYHNVNLRERTPLQRATPMPLAETASIFCETILTDQSLEATTGDERLALLEVDLQGACQVVVDIRSRFLFESRLFERRRESTVSVRELCELMETAQVDAYGDGLDPEARHPYMWAAKPHYYFATFYNWPYTFGLLFGLGLYARWREDADGFRSRYDDLLSSTGLAPAKELARRFDIDLHDQAFWKSSLDVLRSRIDDFCTSVDATAAATGSG
ncbi:MAG TPA: M3 family oligoendopeptidase [Acidimicrobiales bacterium]